MTITPDMAQRIVSVLELLQPTAPDELKGDIRDITACMAWMGRNVREGQDGERATASV